MNGDGDGDGGGGVAVARMVHAWNPMRAPSGDEWERLRVSALIAIAASCEIPAGGATVGHEVITILGLGRGEIFSLERLGGSSDVDTQGEPYDLTVLAILVVSECIGLLRVTATDGSPQQWQHAVSLARAIAPDLHVRHDFADCGVLGAH